MDCAVDSFEECRDGILLIGRKQLVVGSIGRVHQFGGLIDAKESLPKEVGRVLLLEFPTPINCIKFLGSRGRER